MVNRITLLNGRNDATGSKLNIPVITMAANKKHKLINILGTDFGKLLLNKKSNKADKITNNTLRSIKKIGISSTKAKKTNIENKN